MALIYLVFCGVGRVIRGDIAGSGAGRFIRWRGLFWARMSLSAEGSLFFFWMDTCLFTRLVLSLVLELLQVRPVHGVRGYDTKTLPSDATRTKSCRILCWLFHVAKTS